MTFPIKVALLGVIAYLIFIIAGIPASLVLPRHLSGNITLTDISGTIWNGEIGRVTWQGRNVGNLDWHFLPSSLLHAQAGTAFDLHGSDYQINGRFGSRLWDLKEYLSDIHLQADLSSLSNQFKWPVNVHGEAQVYIDHAVCEKQNRFPSIEGHIHWNQAMIETPISTNLGLVSAEFKSGASLSSVSFQLTSGAITGQGVVRLAPGNSYKINAKLLPHTQETRQLLIALGGQPEAENSQMLRLMEISKNYRSPCK